MKIALITLVALLNAPTLAKAPIKYFADLYNTSSTKLISYKLIDRVNGESETYRINFISSYISNDETPYEDGVNEYITERCFEVVNYDYSDKEFYSVDYGCEAL